jgi:RNA polymerase sigma factor (sigma-70 family)
MPSLTDAQLLRDYARTGSERAFGEIVSRHTNLVYSAALRQSGSPELAREITQDVFTDLARKAPALAATLHDDAALGGWLYKGTRYLTLNALRDERRRVAREQKLMHEVDSTPDADEWARVAPVLDEAMAGLNDTEREAVVLRYFQNLDFQSVGRALGVSDDTAQKRVTRAVEHLRELLAKRGVAVGGSGFAMLLAANSVQAVPVGLSQAISAGVFAKTVTPIIAFGIVAMTSTQKILVAVLLLALLTLPGTLLLARKTFSTKKSPPSNLLYFTDLADVGFATPEAALQTYHEAIINQTKRGPLSTTRFKDLWNVPDDFDDPAAKYAINTGWGFGSEVGYRILNQERVASNEVRVVLEYYKRDGSSFQRPQTLIENKAHWRIQPMSIKRG